VFGWLHTQIPTDKLISLNDLLLTLAFILAFNLNVRNIFRLINI
jgi:hypothetical protein